MSILKSSFLLVMLLHGLIHILGFIKANNLMEISSLTNDISRPVGWLWLVASSIFIIATVIFGMNKEWSKVAIAGVILSQILISFVWSDAKFGTLSNVLILCVAMITVMEARFKNSFRQDASESILRSNEAKRETLVNNDIMHLPIPLQKYLHFVDVVGKPKLRNMEVIMKGSMRSKEKDWFAFASTQYNTFDKNERLFFMDGKVNKLPTSGYHYFKDKNAKMDIKLLSVFPVVSESNDLLRKAETVTLFNDMCIMAPASLIDQNIIWEEVNDYEVIAHFTNDGITITASLFFDKEGALINFYSEDRMDISDNKQYGFSTPISGYKDHKGYIMPTYGEAIWHYPEGEFVYGKFDILSISYNVKKVSDNKKNK